MPIYFDRYDRDTHPGMLGIAEFLLSDQLADATRGGAEDVARIANGSAPRVLAGGFAVVEGPVVNVTKRPAPRRSQRVQNNDPAAAAIEFGSGRARRGRVSTADRPQGGWSPPMRVLGKAGDQVADRLGEEDDD